jgi:hypothetical protein
VKTNFAIFQDENSAQLPRIALGSSPRLRNVVFLTTRERLLQSTRFEGRPDASSHVQRIECFQAGIDVEFDSGFVIYDGLLGKRGVLKVAFGEFFVAAANHHDWDVQGLQIVLNFE